MIFFVGDLFVENYKGGAELTTEAIYQSSLFPVNKVHSSSINLKAMKQYKDCFWIFGNFADLTEDCILYAIQNLKYSVLEYDYKYCRYRSPGKHIEMEGECNCHTGRRGKIVAMFLASSVKTWWMSQGQRDEQAVHFPFLNNPKDQVLSSVFSDETLDYIENLDTSKKNNKWIIMNSGSWIKGVEDAKRYAEENNLEYELIWGLEHKEFLNKLADSKGLIFLPKAGDTCPRMVIEAKLLDCELVLNDNVQHKDEAWFDTKETTMKYLRERTMEYWNTMEEVIAEYVNLPQSENESDIRYHVVVPFYNAEKWIGKSIDSLMRQRHKNFICTLIDDVSTDNSSEIVRQAVENDDRFQLISNQEKRYALGNIAYALESTECRLDDVVILLDGDNWLSSSKVLSRLSKAYINEECLLTYGSYVYHPHGERGVEPSEYPQEVVKNNMFRQDKWRASHLRTFKHRLWNNLNHDDLKDEEGNYYKMAYDQAIMLPLLEMSGERTSFIPEILHVYNKENPLNIDKNKAQEQFALAQKIRKKAPYTRL